MTTPVARIMVVDDEPDVEALVTQRFRREIRKGELEFVFAHDGQEALDLLAEDPNVLMVLSDINMPKMDGLTLLGHLEELHQKLKTVVVSAYGDMDNIRTAMNRGAFDFVTKPIDFSDLETTIRKTLRQVDIHNGLQREKLEAEMAHAMLSRYFSPNVAATLSSEKEELKPGGKRQEASFLFTDLQGFTSLVESTDSEIIIRILNGYLDGLARVVFKHEGTVMKVIGDAVHAIFGAPIPAPDHAARAVACALDIDAFAEAFREEWREQGIALGATRIGINTGEAIIGNFGGDTYFDYTAYGDAVNTAARLETANKVLGTRICISESVVQQIDGFQGRPAGHLTLAGKSEVLIAFEPLTEARAQSPEIAAYCSAYALLEKGEDSARQALAGLLALMPDDPLTLCHLQRALGGARDVVIDATRK